MDTTETLEHGDYCEVTREQAVELLKIEQNAVSLFGFFGLMDNYVSDMLAMGAVHMYFDGENEQIVLSAYMNGDLTNQLPFADFRQRLINTVNNGK